ncbi:MAG TPA: nucleotidyl transferase AbiEii/AbiGii toxin family protein, partial [Patescibacteria group bacterium]|nr:nucleotidyl transferase AbiEii/AbiGii toxin family protein [Patescibacteria group bacterium]
MMEEILKNLVDQKKEENTPDFLILNFLKEYLQYPVLDFLYKNDTYRNFIFTGGSCLRICHELPRLSEDLDLDLEEKELEKLDWDKLEKDITRHFKNKYLLDIQTKKQEGKRIYLKFPILNRLNLSYGGGSDFLYVKIEPGKKQFPR